MIQHFYECPACEDEFSVDHPDERVYDDECPNCGYKWPNLVELEDVGEDECPTS